MGEAPLDVAGVVLRARRLADLSQRELADTVGVSQPTIVRWESGGGDPPLDLLQRILAVAGLRLALVADDGTLVRPVDRDSVRDNAGRRFPAHLDVAPPDEQPRNRGLGERYDRPPAKGWYALRPGRDRQAAARPPDHPTATELELRSRMRRQVPRWPPPRGPALAPCICPTECEENVGCPQVCPCRCEPLGSGQAHRVRA